MAKLLIVESPAKAKTITKYLGGDYHVKASMGHLRDLPKKVMGVDIENSTFEASYIPIEGKDKIISELKSAADSADMVYLATDPDREGEAISWHLQQLLGLSEHKTKRITFNEITKKAVTEAVQSPREIDMDLVDAQQARRILDRIVGYKLSPFLWRKVRTGLSAGRVQSVVTRMIVDRERDIKAFVPKEYWSISALLQHDNKEFSASYHGDLKGKKELENEQQTQQVLDDVSGKTFTVKTVKNSKRKRQPAPPFITSTLQQEASRKLGMTARRTMSVAQELYEGVELEGLGATGLITYMRTDSLRLSQEALDGAANLIDSRFGKEYRPSKPRVFRSKKGSQDAHEAIRPSNPELTPDGIKKSLTADQLKLYRLIWSRFIASQMSEALFDVVSADIECGGHIFRASGQTVIFPGFLALYEEGRDHEEDEDSSALPKLNEGDAPALKNLTPKQHFTQPPPRYTEASLIKAMEEQGVGRPSTYAPTISVVLDREYVAKEAKALRPTMLGEAVTDLMIDKFTNIIDLQFTANMEDRLDDVETGKTDYRKLLGEFYSDFDARLQQAEIDLDKKRIKVKDEETEEICELCGKNMVIKSGRFGKFLACPGYPDCKNTRPITQEAGVPCPVCGAKLLKKKSKKGYAYYGCEKNPECAFMTWDSPTNKKCPKCDGTVYRHATKEERKYMCHVPGCGYEAPMGKSTKSKAKDEGEGEEKTAKTAKKTTSKTAKTTSKTTKTASKTAKTTSKTAKTTTKKAAASKTTAKKTTAKKAKEENADAE